MPELIEGQPVFMKGSGAKPYELKNVGGVYSCSCPAWRNVGGPAAARTCKHLKKHCGEAAELTRVAAAGAVAPQMTEDGTRKLRPDEKVKLNGPKLLLAQKLEDMGDDFDPKGWWASEKLDGVRGYWDGTKFLSRAGNVFPAPAWFVEGLPDHPLDGELWLGRRQFQKTTPIVQVESDKWRDVRFLVFDAPHLKVPFEERLKSVVETFAKSKPAYARVHDHVRCESFANLDAELARIVAIGGEGVMLREPKSLYEEGRSTTLVKVKPFNDAEATVIKHIAGKGKFKGMLGAITVRMPNGLEFNLGTGFSNEQRRNPPAIGASVTYRYTELTDGGIPKCGRFVAVRDYE
jgi:DNA ligase-1